MNKIPCNKIKKIYKKIDIDNSIFNIIEYLNYTLLTHEHILQTILNKGRYNYNIDIYDHFMNNYNNAGIELKLIMQEIIQENDPDFLKNDNYAYEINIIDHTIDLFTLEDKGVK